MPEPLVSVVIPTYNSGKFITKTMDSLKTQDFKQFEVLITNDGSTDDTQDVISRYIISNPDLEIKLFNQENKGIAEARNNGIRESRCGYIAFLDHDDIWYSAKLSKCYGVLTGHPDIDLVCHNELMRKSDGEFVKNLYYGPDSPNLFRKLLFSGNCVSTSAVVVRKQALLETGMFRGHKGFLEDYDMWLRLSKKYKFYFLPEILGEYILHTSNITSNIEWSHNSQISVLKRNFNEYEGKKPLDCFLINLRIAKLYLSIVKHSSGRLGLKDSLKYLLKAVKQMFGYD